MGKMEEPDRPQVTTKYGAVAICMPDDLGKDTHTHNICYIFLFHGKKKKKKLCERVPVRCYTFTACLVESKVVRLTIKLI